MKTINLFLMLLLGSWSITLAQSPIIGTWKGSFGSGTSQTGNFYSLQFNADGTMKVLNPDGTVLAPGNCQINNNSVTGTYYYGAARSPYSIYGVFNPQTNTITGTWGAGTSAKGGGGWVMTSKSGGGTSTSAAIPFGTKRAPTNPATGTTQSVTAQPMQVTPKAGTGIVISGVVNTFSNSSNTIPMSDGTRLTVTLNTNTGTLPTNLGGQINEREVSRTSMNSNDPSWNCVNVTKVFSATSNNFLNSEYSATSSSIFPGAIYTAADFLTGNRKVFEFGRNPVEIGVDNVLNTTGPTYRLVNQPTQNEINSAISSIAGSMTGSGEDIKYRVYISESDAEMALNAAASGSYAGFSVSAAYRNRSREHTRIMTIDATKSYFTTSVNLPANGYFSDKSVEQNNKNLVILKNVVYGCRVMANIIITTTGRQDELDFLASYSGVVLEAKGVFNYLKTHSNFESTVNAIVIGGPSGTTTFNAATLEAEISNLIAKANYRTARPIAYTLTDMSGNILGIQSATDQITVPECTPKASIYTLKNISVQVSTGNNDPKNDGSRVYYKLYNSSGVTVASSTGTNNIEFPLNSIKPFDLVVSPKDERWGSMPVADAMRKAQPVNLNDAAKMELFKSGYLDIIFDPVQIALGWDEWQIRGAVVSLKFTDQNGNPLPDIRLNYDNLNVYLKKDKGTLRLPFTSNGITFSAGGPSQQ